MNLRERGGKERRQGQKIGGGGRGQRKEGVGGKERRGRRETDRQTVGQTDRHERQTDGQLVKLTKNTRGQAGRHCAFVCLRVCLFVSRRVNIPASRL